MSRFVFTLALLGLAQPLFSAPIIWPTNGHAYDVIVTTPLTWSNAYLAARLQIAPPGFGLGHLATISNAAENEIVLSLGSPGSADSGAWIGFTDTLVEGEWFWIDNTPGIWQDPRFFANPIQTAYANWEPGPNPPKEPSGGERHADLRSDGYWNDYGGIIDAYYVEFEPVPEPSTIALLGIGVLGLIAYAWKRRNRFQ